MRVAPVTLALFPFLGSFVACGAVDPHEAAQDAFVRGEYGVAVQRFDSLIATAGDEDRFELELDRLRALSYVSAAWTEEGFRALAEDPARGGRITPREVSLVASELVSARAFPQAIAVMDLGMRRFPEDPYMHQVKDAVVAASRASARPAVLRDIDGLPYVSGGE